MRNITIGTLAIIVALAIVTGLYYTAPAPKAPLLPPMPPAAVPPSPIATVDGPHDPALFLSALNQSVMTGNIDACNAVLNENDKNDCKDAFHKHTALQDGDAAECDKILFSGTRQACTNELRMRTATTPADCDAITLPAAKTGCLDNVHMRMARANKDKTLCAKISMPAAVTECNELVDADSALAQDPAAFPTEEEATRPVDEKDLPYLPPPEGEDLSLYIGDE